MIQEYISSHEGVQWLLAIGLGALGMLAGTVALVGYRGDRIVAGTHEPFKG